MSHTLRTQPCAPLPNFGAFKSFFRVAIKLVLTDPLVDKSTSLVSIPGTRDASCRSGTWQHTMLCDYHDAACTWLGPPSSLKAAHSGAVCDLFCVRMHLVSPGSPQPGAFARAAARRQVTTAVPSAPPASGCAETLPAPRPEHLSYLLDGKVARARAMARRRAESISESLGAAHAAQTTQQPDAGHMACTAS
jgi:hypothetical protein